MNKLKRFISLPLNFFSFVWNKQPNLLISSFVLLVTIVLFLMGSFTDFDDYLFSLIYQLNYSESKIHPKIMLIKKDEATSSLLAKNPSRREFGSIIQTLGHGRTIDYPGERSLSCKLFDLRLGLYPPGKKNLVVIPWVGINSSPPTDGITFWRFSENFSRLFEFMEFPFDSLASQPLIMKSSEEFSNDFKQAIAKFVENFLFSKFKFELEICPKPDTVLSWQIVITVDLPKGYRIPPSDLILVDFLLQGAKDKEDDEYLERAIASSEVPIILASEIQAEEKKVENVTSISDKSGKAEKPGKNDKLVSSENSENSISGETWEILPEKRFIQKTTELGVINVAIGDRNFVWQVPLFHYLPKQERLVPAISLVAAAISLDQASMEPTKHVYTKAMRSELDRILPLLKKGTYQGGFQLNDRFIPTDSKGFMGIYFYGSGKFNRFHQKNLYSASFYECFDDETLAFHANRVPESASYLNPVNAHKNTLGEFANYGGRICIVGPYEKSDFDFFPTPMTKDTPFKIQDNPLAGMEVHANAILSILDGKFSRHPKPLDTLILLIISTLLFGKLLENLTPFKGTIITALFLAGIFYFANYSFNKSGQLIIISPMLFSYPMVWITHTFKNYLDQRKKAGQIKSMFQRFVSADVVQFMIDNPNFVKPGGQRVELTVFFSDVAGFTSISEMLTPEELVVLLNEYLGTMTDILFKYGGTLDKFIGDAVMAFWNYPRGQEDHAVRACLCALEMQEKITELQKGWAERKLPKIAARAGINTAFVSVGYMGSEKAQMNFTCMGDGVNLASRLEGANKEYGTYLMISDATYQKAKDQVTVRFLDFLAVKGKKEPVKVHQLVSRKGQEPFEWSERIALYDKAIALHLERKWDEAISTFEELLSRWPDDGPSKTYLSRCHEYRENPPPEDWDGSYHLTHK
ncbi:MAG: CHASE2 domain-containing protein [Candidatus Riflebacteria bacterium]|nr:CHASE2 domain-containing protein [Candidatus Riflebacteria bacterium]